MNTDQIVTIVVGIAQSGAAGLIFWALLRSLKIQVDGLQKTISVQSTTITAMEKRVGEAEKIGDLYKGLVKDLPSLLESLSKGKDQIIKDLHASIEHREKVISDKSAPNIQNKADAAILVTMKFMLSGDRNELTQFSQNLIGNVDTAAVLLSRTKSFDDFVQSSGGRIQFENDKDKFNALMQSSNLNLDPTGFRFATSGLGGFYGISADKKVVISSSKYHDLKGLFDQLKIQLQAL
jgi:hypothetical protein